MLQSTSSHSPKYAQIADVIRQRVGRGVLCQGHKLPTNEELAKEFGVSRITIRQAVELLAREGLIKAHQGRGTYVTGSPGDDRWLRVATSLSTLVEIYRDTLPEILNIEESNVNPSLRPADGVAAERYIHMRRIHSRQGQVYSVISIYLDERVFRKHPRRFRKEVVIPILTEMRDPAIARAHQTLTIGSADVETARLLKIPLNSPIAEVRRVFNSEDGLVFYLGEVTYRADFVKIEMDLMP